MKIIVAILFSFLLFSGCAASISRLYEQHVKANHCEVVEARQSWRANIVYVTCWDSAGEAMPVAAVSGVSMASIISSLVKAGATVAAGGMIGSAVGGIDLDVMLPKFK